MTKSWLTYRIFLPLLATMSLVGFWRINKVSFFHHFIRVISEVEVRNSQSLSEASLPVLAMAAEAPAGQDATQATLATNGFPPLLALAAQATSWQAAARPGAGNSSPVLIRGP